MDFPDTLFDRSLLFAFERLFIFAASQLALNLDMGSFLERGGEVGQRPEYDSAMPFCARFPFASLLIFPRRFGGQGQKREGVVVLGLTTIWVAA